MSTKTFQHGKQVIIRTSSLKWNNYDKLLESRFFRDMLEMYLKKLDSKDSDFLRLLPKGSKEHRLARTLEFLTGISRKKIEDLAEEKPEFASFSADKQSANDFVEGFYNYWRAFERYFVVIDDNDLKLGTGIDEKPFRTFNDTIENLNHLVRSLYRDIQENIVNEHPNVYRQVAAGCQAGVIAAKKDLHTPSNYAELKKIPVIRQVLIEPPLIIDPPMNKRKGEFMLVDSNPLEGIKFDEKEWLCFPAKVGELVVHFYFHNFYMGLGISVANLFDLCRDTDLEKKPDAIYAYGVPGEALARFGENKTVFYNDAENKLMVAAIPKGDEFGYFGYIKKMILTLYNSIMIQWGRMPVHGAMTQITMKNGASANVIIFGDTGTGKSESLEAFRKLGEEYLKDMKIIFDDMGSLAINEKGDVIAYGTETGAFVRLDDLDSGFAFGNMDRSIIHSPQKVNARAVLPITTLRDVLKGTKVDYFLYANNYDEVTEEEYLHDFGSWEEAISVFREGKRMAKGTTNEIGITSAYFANIFGPSQFREEHEPIAEKFFRKMFENKVFVGRIKTQLGIKGMETKGPEKAAEALFKKVSG